MANPNKSQTHIDAPLTNISVAYMENDKTFIADKIFPVVPVAKSSDKYFVYDKGDWFRDEAEERAAGTESAGGGYNVSNDSFLCVRYAFHKDIFDENEVDSDAPLNPARDATLFVTKKLMLRREIQFMDTYFTDGVWSTDITGVASSPSAGQVIQWDQSGGDPIGDIDDAVFYITSQTGYKPNVLILGPDVFKILKNHADILDRIKYTERGVIAEDILANVFGVEKVLVAYAIKNAGIKGASDSMDFIAGKAALLVYAAPNASLYEPSAGYIFSWTGLMGAGAFGNRVSRIPTPLLGEGSYRVEAEMSFDAKVVATDLGYFFKTIVS